MAGRERGIQMSKQKDPAFLFYPADFLIGTMDMTDEEVGIYIRLLCRQHQKGNIRPDLKINGQLMEDLPGEILSKFCRDNQGNYYNKRLKTEIEKREKFTQSRKANGSKGGRPKNHMDNLKESNREAIGKPTDNHTENENVNENVNESKMYGEFENVRLSGEELEKLKLRFPYDWQQRIENLSQYMKSKGRRYKNHYATMLAWARKETKENDEKEKGRSDWIDDL